MAGSLKFFKWDGVDYAVVNDGDAQVQPGSETESIVTNAGNSPKVTLGDGRIEAIKLKLKKEEWNTLNVDAKEGKEASASIGYANGEIDRGKAFISVGAYSSMDEVAELIATPVNGEWETF